MSIFHLENLDDLRKNNIFQHLPTWNMLSRQKFSPAIQLGENMFGTVWPQWPFNDHPATRFCKAFLPQKVRPSLRVIAITTPHHTTIVKWDVFFFSAGSTAVVFFFPIKHPKVELFLHTNMYQLVWGPHPWLHDNCWPVTGLSLLRCHQVTRCSWRWRISLDVWIP